MKHFKIHVLIVNALVLLSLFLPYQLHKIFNDSNEKFDFYNSSLKEIVPLSGIELPETYFFLGGVLGITFITLVWRSLATAIIGSVLSIGLGLYTPLLAFILMFRLFQEGDELAIGFYIASLAIVYFVVIQFINLVKEAKNRKSKGKGIPEDILDDF